MPLSQDEGGQLTVTGRGQLIAEGRGVLRNVLGSGLGAHLSYKWTSYVCGVCLGLSTFLTPAAVVVPLQRLVAPSWAAYSAPWVLGCGHYLRSRLLDAERRQGHTTNYP